MHKRIEKVVKDASIWNINRRGIVGINIQIAHTVEGPKHTTTYITQYQFDLCELRWIGVQLHKIMDELQAEWNEAKRLISGGQ